MTPDQNYTSWFNEEIIDQNRTEINTPLEIFKPDSQSFTFQSPETQDSINIMQALKDAKLEIKELKKQLFNQSRTSSVMEKPCSTCH